MVESLAIGLMSGTSLDGVDAALLASDGGTRASLEDALSLAYDDATRRAVRRCFAGKGDVPAVARRITLRHAEAVEALLRRTRRAREEIRVIGFPGQTIAHRPAEGLTWQIGDGALLASTTGVDVVSDFRSRDVAAGGQGAPLAPLYHAALVRAQDSGPTAVLNIGGVANVTWIGSDGVMAFDTGPGGALLDDWMLEGTGARMDLDGAHATSGRVHRDRLDAVLADPFFARPPPKSLDRNAFRPDLRGLSVEDGAATLTALTAEAVNRARRHFPAPADLWIVCGGGRRNGRLMTELRDRLSGNVVAAEDAGWNGDSLEAEAFAYLALRSLDGLPLSLPSTTGCREAVTGGALHRAG